MLAIISFTLLGIWTAILGFINNTDWNENSDRESILDLHRQPQRFDVQLEAQQPEVICPVRETPIAPSETFEAFKNLWKEIIHGV
tara:strand:+ start:4381 stop:4635 length:255 start_codon:yes stop_codon:yes gene_type:complete